MKELFTVFGRIGLLSFGGPAAQIALMHQELVDKRDWLSEDQFLRALSFCMLLPGPEAMQLATYAGWKRAGILGGLIGGGLFVLPGAIVISALALLYGAYGNLSAVQALFVGVQATVIIIVIAALIKIAKRALVGQAYLAIAILAFIALFFFAVPFPIVVLVAGIAGALMPGPATAAQALPSGSLRSAARVVVIGGAIWAAPVIIVALTGSAFLLDVAAFFSLLAVVTFGGAYAVLAYMTQEVVFSYGWLTTPQMMDALGLAETTPGPLILVTQFVAMIAGLAQGGVGLSIAAGALTLWVTFVPCFIWIFAGAPLIDWLDGRPRLRAALAGITAAVVGVIANLSLWFALHVIFDSVTRTQAGVINMVIPDPASLQPVALLLIAVAGVLLLLLKWSLLRVLPLVALLGLGLITVIGGS
ncbi:MULTISPECIES: chromate efflux transporter [unclassified Yoonia]|uniref:chromate efflux transporter n=1 Tax=unclassified Yoonia TaxID=2629118 RepID=UPI002AFF9016|nr:MULTISPECIES: chromate efflux transporter [unclassified Yoonia]